MQLFRYTPSIIASAIALLLLYLLFLIFKPFATALIFSAVMVVLFYPIHTRMNHVMPKNVASLLSTLLVFMIIIVPGLLIIAGIAHETIALSQTITSVSVEKIMSDAHVVAGKLNVDLDLIIKEVIQKITSQAGQLTLHVIENTWSMFIGIFVTLLATYFFFRDGEKIVNFVKSLFFDAAWIEKLIKKIMIMIKSNISVSFIAASIQGIIGGLAFAWFNLPAPILWGTVMGFFSIFPFIGSWLVWIPAAAGLALAGRSRDALLLIFIGLIVVSPIDNILRPAIIGSATRLNILLVFISLLGGVQAFGISGILIGPVILILITGLLTSNIKIRL